MAETVTTRLSDEFVAGLDEIAKKEQLDKSAIIRRLLARAIQEWREDYAIEQYEEGKFSIGQAAKFTKLSLWEFFDLLKTKKIPVNYDTGELEAELKTIRWKKRK